MDVIIKQKLDAFFSRYPRVDLTKDQAILAAEQAVPDTFWIETGAVRMYLVTDDGDEVTIQLFRPQSFFPMMNLLSHHESNALFQAATATTTRRAPGADVISFLGKNPDVLFDLTSRFADGIAGLVERIEQLATKNALSRVASLLTYLAERFGKPEGNHTCIDLPLTHEDISTWTGLARETVSHQIECLRQMTVIENRGRQLVIVKPRRLQLIGNNSAA